jgi:hypothetical protein
MNVFKRTIFLFKASNCAFLRIKLLDWRATTLFRVFRYRAIFRQFHANAATPESSLARVSIMVSGHANFA